MSLGKPFLYQGDLVVDDRGGVGFANAFTFEGVKRFYTVTNHRVGYVRGWHAHQTEFKYVMVVSGAAVVAAVKIDNWEKPSKKCKIFQYNLSEHKPTVLYVPMGYANNFMSLQDNTKLIFFSNLTLEESTQDDYRYDADYWNPWQPKEGLFYR